MSKALVKNNLKAAKAAIDDAQYEKARNLCLEILRVDPSNYYGNVFLGLAYSKTGEAKESEAAYKKAIEGNPNDVVAWQGLVGLYETSWQVDEYIDSSKELGILLMNKEDRTRCQTVIEKVPPFAEKNGTKSQYKKALGLLLPDSPLYDFLEGVIPRPADTYQKLANIIEAEEKEYINNQISARKSRLGATQASATVEVKREVLRKSPLQEIYKNIIDWTHDDQVRRDYEAKQFKLGYDTLEVLPKEDKAEHRLKVLKWAEGIVILKSPYELAWRTWIEWQDYDSIGNLDATLLRGYVHLFPGTGLEKILRAYLDSEISPFPAIEIEESEEEEGGVSLIAEIGPDERLDFMIEGLAAVPRSMLGHRILGEYYLFLNEYENTVDVCRSGKKVIARESLLSGTSFQRNDDAITISLATALVHYQAPKHHPEATSYFKDILTRNNKNTGALIGLGLILEEEGEFGQAAEFLQQALLNDNDNLKVISEAAWCEIQQGHYDLGIGQLQSCFERIAGTDPQSRDLKAQILWRIGSALWDSEPGARSDREKGYYYFMQALRNNPNFAPAFTSLGIYYEDIAQDIDRANKCFQKAFELSPGEYEAAERLARSFANTREWELVEIVARRAADADKKRTTPGKAATWPQVALGVVELNNLNFPLAIQAFQTALRTSPKDSHSWIGLGEAYSSSGRYIAAMKAFNQALLLDPENWFITYMMSNVRQELGEYDEACEGYRQVLEKQPTEFGVLMALGETLIAAAYSHLHSGFYGRAVDAAVEAIQTAKKILEINSTAFNLWKLLGDASSLFTYVQDSLDRYPASEIADLLISQMDIKELNILSEADNVGASTLDGFFELPPLQQCLTGSILAYKRGIYTSAEDRYAHAVAWYNLGCAEYRAFICPNERKTSFRNSAITCFKRAIKLEPGNSEFWNSLGVVTSDVNPRVAQHALVRALHIDEKNARVWTNLGTLYLLQEDFDLANQSFTRGQSADPDYAHAWVGQGLVALGTDDLVQAQELFEHASQISEGYSSIVKKQFATSTFDLLLQNHVNASSMSSLINPLFAVHKMGQQLGNDAKALHLAALYEERAEDFDSASKKLMQVCDIVEAKYEETEANEDLVMYAQAKADLARSYLGLKEYEQAIESASLALDLSDGLELVKCRLSAHLTSGLAHYFLGRHNESLDMFKVALTESSENPDVVALLSQVLWAKGGEDEREVASQQLLSSIEKHPEHLLSTMLLGVMSAVDKDETIMQTVLDELEDVRGDDSKSPEELRRVNKLLLAIMQVSGSDVDAAVKQAVLLNPTGSMAWKALADVSGERFPAEMALQIAGSRALPDAEELSDAFAGAGTLEDTQMGVVIAPWRAKTWEQLVRDVESATS